MLHFKPTDHPDIIAGANKLVDLIPGWEVEAVRTKEAKELRQYLITQGYTEEEVDLAADYRILHLAYRAMKAGL